MNALARLRAHSTVNLRVGFEIDLFDIATRELYEQALVCFDMREIFTNIVFGCDRGNRCCFHTQMLVYNDMSLSENPILQEKKFWH